MRHASDGVLRRLDDEPLAVADSVSEHVADCARCSARRAEIARDTERAAQLFAVPTLAPDLAGAWGRLQRELSATTFQSTDRRLRAVSASAPTRLPRVPLRASLAIGAVGIAVAGTAAAATLTTIFAPTHVAPVSVSQGDVRHCQPRRPRRQPLARRVRHSDRVKQTALRHHHVVVRHWTSGVLARPGLRAGWL